MFFSKKQKENKTPEVKDIVNEDYEAAASYAGGIGGFGLNMPKDKSKLKEGWWCPNCENIYSPDIKECKPCNKLNKALKKKSPR